MTSRRDGPIGTTTLLALAAVVTLAGCGSEDQGTTAATADQAFLQAMVPHHEAAIDMARVAQGRAEHAEIKRLADAIVEAQTKEIGQLAEIHQRLFDEELTPDPAGHQALGLSAEQAGMTHMESAAELARAEPFDRAFIDEMVGHHAGAIRMAEAVLDETDDNALRSLATDIIDAQTRELERMNRWREQWYGEPSPAQDIPARDDTPAEGNHNGHSP